MKNLIFIILLLVLTTHFTFSQPIDIESEEAQRSGQEIRLLNLLNSLYLTSEQIQFILNRLRRLEDLKKGDPDIEKEYEESLEGIKEDLKQDNFVPDEKREEFQRLKRNIGMRQKEYMEMGRQFAEEIKGQLTPIQQQVIEDYNPCIIPPKGPSRIGQASEPQRVEKQLEDIYNMPEGEYVQNKYDLAEKTLKRWMEFKAHGIRFKELIDEKELSDKILEFYDRIRGLDEIEFTANKEKLAKEFTEIFPKETKEQDLTTKIQRFLLNPAIIPLLEERLQSD